MKRVIDRVMSAKLEIEDVMMNDVGGYAPQIGCDMEERAKFWTVLDEVVIPMVKGTEMMRK